MHIFHIKLKYLPVYFLLQPNFSPKNTAKMNDTLEQPTLYTVPGELVPADEIDEREQLIRDIQQSVSDWDYAPREFTAQQLALFMCASIANLRKWAARGLPTIFDHELDKVLYIGNGVATLLLCCQVLMIIIALQKDPTKMGNMFPTSARFCEGLRENCPARTEQVWYYMAFDHWSILIETGLSASF